MSIYTFLIVAMLVAMAFNKDRLFMLTLILYLLIMFFEAMADSNQRNDKRSLKFTVRMIYFPVGRWHVSCYRLSKYMIDF